MGKTIRILAVLLVCGVVVGAMLQASAGTAGKVPVPSQGTYVGAYISQTTDPQELVNLEVFLNRGFDAQRIVYDSPVPDITTGTSQVQEAIRRGRTPWISIQPPGTWSEVAAGNHDAQIDELAADIKSLGVPVFFTPGPHPQQQPAQAGDYPAMWKRYHTRFNDAGVKNVSWGWVVQDNNLNPSDPLFAITTSTYPGDNYVDWIGITSYNMLYDVTTGYDYCRQQGQTESKPANTADLIANRASYPCQAQRYADTALNTQWQDFTVRISGALNWIRQNHASKPMAVEFGVTYDWRSDARRGQYFDVMRDRLKNPPYTQIKLLTYNNEPEWKLGWPAGNQGYDKVAFKNMVNDPYYNTQHKTPPDTTPPTIELLSPTQGTYQGTVTGEADAEDNVGVDRVAFLANGNWLYTDYQAPYVYDRDTTVNDDGEYTIQAVAYDEAGNLAESQPVPITVSNFVPGDKPTITSFTASPGTVEVGQTSLLTWATQDAAGCTVSPGGSENTMQTSWTTPVQSQAGLVEYTLTCQNQFGSATQSLQLTVVAAPKPPAKPLFGASETQIKPGEDVLLSWSSEGAVSCSLQPGDIQASGEIGSRFVSNIQETTIFNLTCYNDAGSAQADPVTVTVTPEPQPQAPEILLFSATPDQIKSGETTTIRWQTANVAPSGCNIAPSPTIADPVNGVATTPPLTTSTTLILTCSNEVGQVATSSTSVIVDGEPAPPVPSPNPPPHIESDEKLQGTTGEEVINAAAGGQIVQGDKIAMWPGIVTDQDTIDRVTKVEYYVDGVLVQTRHEPPFAMDTSQLKPGMYTITERIYFNDGTVAFHSRTITIDSPQQNGWAVWVGIGVVLVLLIALILLRRLALKSHVPAHDSNPNQA